MDTTAVTLFRDVMPWTSDVIDQIFQNAPKAFYVWMVNGNSKDYLKKALKGKKHILLEDDTPQFDINPYMFAEPEEKKKALYTLAGKIYRQYSTAFQHVKPNGLCWVVEDDVIVPDNALAELKKNLVDYNLATIAGRMLDRRPHMLGQNKCVVNDYTITIKLGSKDCYEAVAKQIDADLTNYYPPTQGIQIVGSTHMGCWLTRAELIKNPGISLIEDGCLCVDNNWGWRVYKATGLRVGINWGVSCKHCYMDNGVTVYAE